MKDYRVTVKVRNNRILKAIEAAGGTPGQKWCEENGLTYALINDLINMTASPLTNGGELRSAATKLCDAVDCLPEDLWSNEQLYPLERNFSELEMSYEGVLEMLSETRGMSYLHDFDGLEREQQKNAMDDALASLTKREEMVIRLRVYDERTFEEISNLLGITRERIRQIEAKALRKMKHPSRVGALLPAVMDESLIPLRFRN